PAPCILKESGDRSLRQSVDRAVNQALATSVSRSSCQTGDRAVHQAIELCIRRSSCASGDRSARKVNIKKQGKFLTKVQVSVESAV
ncbi:hypothetical protein QUB08_31870, partial [Microcoleus sp. BR0-C5]|uniref:hypothetical protein n=1 Tax=Microcoleus sp. BR0-C5 TaxID=2818713 RepID=UPI002FD08A29